jgi:PQQ-dependent catabolism-associated beta-propeller protein
MLKKSALLEKIVLALILGAATSGCNRSTGPRAFVTNERDGTITVIDTQSDRVVSTIKVGGRLRGIRLDADKKTIWVAISYPSNQPQGENAIAKIDQGGTILAKYAAGSDPENFALNGDDSRLYIANEDAGLASITDVKTNRVIDSMSVGLEPEGAAISPNGRWVYITSESSSTVTVIDTQTNQAVKSFLVGARPREAVFTSDGSRAYVSAENGGTLSVIDTSDHHVTKTIEFPKSDATTLIKPKGIAISPDGKRVYVATGRGNSVAVVDGESLTFMQYIPVGQRPWGVALTADGRKLYVANGLSNDVSVIDTQANKVIATIKAGDGPWGIAL